MTREGPTIPVEHFLKELFKAMKWLIEATSKEKDKDILLNIERHAQISRPWKYLYEAYLNHDCDFNWLRQWCSNCLNLSRHG